MTDTKKGHEDCFMSSEEEDEEIDELEKYPIDQTKCLDRLYTVREGSKESSIQSKFEKESFKSIDDTDDSIPKKFSFFGKKQSENPEFYSDIGLKQQNENSEFKKFPTYSNVLSNKVQIEDNEKLNGLKKNPNIYSQTGQNISNNNEDKGSFSDIEFDENDD